MYTQGVVIYCACVPMIGTTHHKILLQLYCQLNPIQLCYQLDLQLSCQLDHNTVMLPANHNVQLCCPLDLNSVASNAALLCCQLDLQLCSQLDLQLCSQLDPNSALLPAKSQYSSAAY
jgi:hypothetical protein